MFQIVRGTPEKITGVELEKILSDPEIEKMGDSISYQPEDIFEYAGSYLGGMVQVYSMKTLDGQTVDLEFFVDDIGCPFGYEMNIA